MTTPAGNDFFRALRALHQQSARSPLAEDAAIQDFITQQASFGVSHAAPSVEQRADEGQTYLIAGGATPANREIKAGEWILY